MRLSDHHRSQQRSRVGLCWIHRTLGGATFDDQKDQFTNRSLHVTIAGLPMFAEVFEDLFRGAERALGLSRGLGISKLLFVPLL